MPDTEDISALERLRRGMDGDVEIVRKALVVSNDDKDAVVEAPNQRPATEAEQNFFLGAGALIPRYDPWALAAVYEKSSALRPCVDAYATNVTAFGFQLDPVIDLEKADAPKLVKTALRAQRRAEGNMQPIADEEVESMIELMRAQSELEKFDLMNFFAFCCPDQSFVELRSQTRIDLESTGNAYWEIVRDGAKRIAFIVRIDSVTMRLRAVDQQHVVVPTKEKSSPISYRTRNVPRRFRTYVQLVNGLMAVYFKEFGDPRILSAKSGHFFKSLADLKRAEGNDAIPATECVHWKIHSPVGPYGVPRWVGATMNVLGLRASEEVNYTYFDNNSMPPFAILVSGGSLKKDAADKIKSHLREVRGRENMHSPLILEAEPPQGATRDARVRVVIEPLTRQQDGLFQEYEANSTKKIGQQFRLPDLLRGASEETNRAQAQAVLEFAEQQVFHPLREADDHWFNRRLLADMGIRFWVFKTNTPEASDPETLSKIAETFSKMGAITPNEGRVLAGEALNREYRPTEEDWGKQPSMFTLAGIIPAGDAPAVQFDQPKPGVEPPPEQKATTNIVQRLLAARSALRGDAQAGADEATTTARAAQAATVLRVPAETFKDWVEPDAAEE